MIDRASVLMQSASVQRDVLIPNTCRSDPALVVTDSDRLPRRHSENCPCTSVIVANPSIVRMTHSGMTHQRAHTVIWCCYFFQSGTSPLHLAALHGKDDACKALVKLGASTEIRDAVSLQYFHCSRVL